MITGARGPAGEWGAGETALSGGRFRSDGGETGIRTQVRVSPKHAFQACAFSHSAISPRRGGVPVSMIIESGEGGVRGAEAKAGVRFQFGFRAGKWGRGEIVYLARAADL